MELLSTAAFEFLMVDSLNTSSNIRWVGNVLKYAYPIFWKWDLLKAEDTRKKQTILKLSFNFMNMTGFLFLIIRSPSAWCPLKGHTYLNKHAAESCRFV